MKSVVRLGSGSGFWGNALGDWVKGPVEVYPMDNIGAVMVFMHHAPGGGATRTLRFDQTGTSLGNAILRLALDTED
jgi:hypothetical protein